MSGSIWHRVFLGILCALLLAGCSGGDGAGLAGSASGMPSGAAGAVGGGADASVARVDEAGALSALAAPDGVDAELWEMLTAELGRVLAECDAAAAGDASGKLASTPPLGEASATVLTYNASASTLSWGYYSQGDYNQDGLVGISDLTPLGQHYGEGSPLGAGQPFPPDSLGAVIDGNGDGIINISDITQIGQSYGARVDSYRIYAAEDTSPYPAEPAQPNSTGAKLLATVALAEASDEPGERRLFYAQVVPTKAVQYYWVRPCDDMEDGVASNYVEVLLPPNSPPEAELHYSGAPRTPAHIIWDATPSHDPDGMIVKCEWDFDGDGMYEHTGAAQVDFYYYAAGQYACGLRVTDNEGATDTDATVVNVLEEATWHVNLADERYKDLRPGLLEPRALFEVAGNPALVYSRLMDEQDPYEEYGNYACAYLRAQDPTGESWPEPLLIDSAAAEAGAMVEDQPAIVFKMSEGLGDAGTENLLWYVRASDPVGTTWENPRHVASYKLKEGCYTGDYWSSMTAIHVVGGNPALYSNSGVQDYPDAFFVRAADTKGDSWPAPWRTSHNTGDPQTAVGGYLTSLVVSSNDLLYYRALDLDALYWAEPVLVDEHEKALSSPALLEVAGLPAVVYYDEVTDDLRYRRALDVQGTSWLEPLVLSSRSGTSHRSLLIDGRPCVFYIDRISGSVNFVAANNQAGSLWSFESGVPLDSKQFKMTIGSRPATIFADINGVPAVAYMHSDGEVYRMYYMAYY